MLLPKTAQAARKGFPTNDTWLIYGQPKIGKTTLGSQFPSPLIVDLENGASEINGFITRIKNLDDVSELMGELENDERFKTIVVDSVDVAYDWIEREVCYDLSNKFKTDIQNMGEGPNGTDWAEARKRFLGFIEAWRRLDKTIVFIAHAKSGSSEGGTLQQRAKTIDLPGKLAHRFPAKVDSIAFCYAKKEKEKSGKDVINRYISFQPYEELEAGSRRKELQGKTLPMSFEAIKACFQSNGDKK